MSNKFGERLYAGDVNSFQTGDRVFDPKRQREATVLVFNRRGEILIEYDSVLTEGHETFGRDWVSAETLKKLTGRHE